MKVFASIFAVGVVAAGCTGTVERGDMGQASPGVTEAPCVVGATRACLLADAGLYPVLTEQTCVQGASESPWGACEPAACSGTELACVTMGGKAGVASCAMGVATSTCGVIGDCHPGDVMPTSMNGECPAVSCAVGQEIWDYPGCLTPLVLAFGGQAVEFTQAPGDFDLAGRGATVPTRWVSGRTPWLVLDRNGNGTVDDGSELFGSMTRMGNRGRASNGFAALAALDDDGDGSITPRDASFDALLLWRDDDQDRKSEPAELTTLRDAGVTAIHLDYRDAPLCDDGDCAVERATFEYRDARGARRLGEAIDVHFAPR